MKTKEELLVINFDKGNIKRVKKLIEQGADVNYTRSNIWDGTPLLIEAINRVDIDMVKLLVENGADLNKTCHWNNIIPIEVANKDIEHYYWYNPNPMQEIYDYLLNAEIIQRTIKINRLLSNIKHQTVKQS